MSDKRTNRVSVFLSDRELQALALDGDEEGRELSDYLRWLAIDRHRKKEEAHAARIVAATLQSERDREALHALMRQQVPPSATVTGMQAELDRRRSARAWDGREDDGFPSTVGTGQQS
jgi:hypothetical protein